MVDIVETAVGDIKPDPKNTNTHTPEQVDQIAASIKRFGFNDPIAVDQNGIIAEGHGRLMAANLIGLERVPVIRLTFASEAERRAYGIAHNRTQQLTTLDEKAVLREFDRIGVDTGDFEAIGFTEDEVVFMSLRQGADDDAAAGGGAGRASFAVNTTPTTVIDFETQDELFGWLSGLDWLRDLYPDSLTVSERLLRMVEQHEGSL